MLNFIARLGVTGFIIAGILLFPIFGLMGMAFAFTGPGFIQMGMQAGGLRGVFMITLGVFFTVGSIRIVQKIYGEYKEQQEWKRIDMNSF